MTEGYRYSITIVFKNGAFPKSETMEYDRKPDLKRVIADNVTRETFLTMIITDWSKNE